MTLRNAPRLLLLGSLLALGCSSTAPVGETTPEDSRERHALPDEPVEPSAQVEAPQVEETSVPAALGVSGEGEGVVGVLRAGSDVDEVQASPVDLAFADAVLSAGQAIVASVRGQSIEARWLYADEAEHDLRGTPEDVRAMFASGPEPELLFVALEVEGSSSSQRTRNGAMVLPDRSVRYVHLAVSEGGGSGENLGQLFPEAQAFLDQLISKLRTDCGSLRLATPADMPDVPASLAAELTGMTEASRAQVCAAVGSDPFEGELDDITVAVRVGTKLFALRSEFDGGGQVLFLGPVRAREMR